MLGDFLGIKNLDGLNDLNNLSGLNDLYSIILPKKTFILKYKCIFLMVCYFLLLEKGPKSHIEPIYFALLNSLIYLSSSRGRATSKR